MTLNIVDWTLIAILGIAALFGLYRGFIASVLKTAGTILSFYLSFLFTPKAVAFLEGNTELVEWLGANTDIASRVGDAQLASMEVVQMGTDAVRDVISRVQLPDVLSRLLEANLVNQTYAGQAGVTQVQDYLAQTIISACVNVICFTLCFFVCYLLVTLVVSVIRSVFELPVLKQLDALLGGAFGLLTGALICFVLMALVPLVQSMVTYEPFNQLIAESRMAQFFGNGTMLLAVMTNGIEQTVKTVQGAFQ